MTFAASHLSSYIKKTENHSMRMFISHREDPPPLSHQQSIAQVAGDSNLTVYKCIIPRTLPANDRLYRLGFSQLCLHSWGSAGTGRRQISGYQHARACACFFFLAFLCLLNTLKNWRPSWKNLVILPTGSALTYLELTSCS